MTILYKNRSIANRYCVPAALAGCLNITVEEAIGLLLSKLGDVTISGLHTSFIVPILKEQGCEVTPIDPAPSSSWLSRQRGKFLVVAKGHVQIVENGTLFDNNHPSGVQSWKVQPLLVWRISRKEVIY